MECHYYICDCCGQRIKAKEKMATLYQDYTEEEYDLGDYMGTNRHYECYHICSSCFEKIKKEKFNKYSIQT